MLLDHGYQEYGSSDSEESKRYPRAHMLSLNLQERLFMVTNY